MKRSLLTRITFFMASALTLAAAAPVSATQIPWNVETVQSSGTQIGNLTAAQSLLAGGIAHSVDVSAEANTLNYTLPGQASNGHFPNEVSFPGITSANEYNFAVHATANVNITSPGTYTFGVNSDDGFQLTVGSNVISYPTPRAAGDSLATFNFPAAGAYPIDLVYFQHAGGGDLEVFASSGSYTTFAQSGSNFQLVGDTANGGLSLASAPTPEPSTGFVLVPIALGLLLRRRSIP
ncbi:MAG TPA: PA14 domain-containing protein [Tepidisphaeraceae bacterium]|jgi:hypothetical protein|nr:PA14 domain-containing protein [Tepidisphaeraceae bacterium]